jgi:hypothetical protein
LVRHSDVADPPRAPRHHRHDRPRAPRHHLAPAQQRKLDSAPETSQDAAVVKTHKVFNNFELTFSNGRPSYVRKATYRLTLGCPF